MLRKKAFRNFFLPHFCARQGTRTPHKLTYAQNDDNKGSKKFNQIKLNVLVLVVGKEGPKKVFSFYHRARQGTQTH